MGIGSEIKKAGKKLEKGAKKAAPVLVGGPMLGSFSFGLDSLKGSGGGGGGSQEANQTWANLMRAQWDDYLQRYGPLEQRAIDLLNEPADVGGAVAAVGASFDSAQRQRDQGLADLGVAVRPDEQTAMDRQMNLQRAASEARAVSDVHTAKRNRDLALMGGGFSVVPNKMA